MKIVMKGNKQLQVPDEKLQEFLALGYNEINEYGEVISVGRATTLAAYEAENKMLKIENAQLKEEIKKLKLEKCKEQEKKAKSKA